MPLSGGSISSADPGTLNLGPCSASATNQHWYYNPNRRLQIMDGLANTFLNIYGGCGANNLVSQYHGAGATPGLNEVYVYDTALMQLSTCTPVYCITASSMTVGATMTSQLCSTSYNSNQAWLFGTFNTTSINVTYPSMFAYSNAVGQGTVALPSAWYSASTIAQGGGSRVSTWMDTANSTNKGIQATPATQPYYQLSVINGHPGLEFSGAQFLNTTSMFPTGSDYTVLLVLTIPYNNTGGNLVCSCSTQSHSIDIHSGNSITVYQTGLFYNGSTQQLSSYNSPYMISVGYTNATKSVQYYVNGLDGGMAMPPTSVGDIIDPSICIGALGGAYGMQGMVGEVLVFPTLLSTSDSSYYQTNLRTMYGF